MPSNRLQAITALPALGSSIANTALMELVQNDTNYRITYQQLRSSVLGYSNPNVVCGIVNGELQPISNLPEAPDDGKAYIRRGKNWVSSSMESPTDPHHQLVRRADQWERIDRLDLKILDPAGLAGYDLDIAQVFKMNGTLDSQIRFKNEPDPDRTIEVTLIITGSGGILSWPPGMIWDQLTAPQMGNLITVIKMIWTGTVWVGRVFMKA